ncbi:PP2C family protein-serine/threonine phosphatase [Thermomonospora umbrina]|uniref:Serine phosphatase RsbU (Regulator of sigma subunit) n=1 Tax=Thermomonospora umbrina TaxID=111806 RepID=A0A3D9SMH3_9ACTN|nr:PP2C family protein-serine/threonine phosphatase [Thermomonospora umbrina]REE95610.1 serine phosphatase RsbU (regulator of sigma subunit) [Thermomonospora umbrina]
MRPDRTRGPFLRWLPFVVMATVVTGDLLAGREEEFSSPLLALGPAFASLASGIRRTALVGAMALLAGALLASYNDMLGTRTSTLTLLSIAGVTLAAMLATAIRERRERELADIRTVAEVAQRVLLRPVPRRVGPVDAAVTYMSAATGALIGGDLYELVTTGDRARIIVGDVQGKGLDAVETAAVVLGAFREAAHQESDLHAVAARIDQALSRHLTSEQFVTAVLAEVGPDDTITLMNCGHPAPLLIHADGVATLAEPPDHMPPLGIAVPLMMERPLYEVPFMVGDQILLYTDGVIEARDPHGEFYPLLQRAHLLEDPDPEVALERLRLDLIQHVAAHITDDTAMLLLRRHTVTWDNEG